MHMLPPQIQGDKVRPLLVDRRESFNSSQSACCGVSFPSKDELDGVSSCPQSSQIITGSRYSPKTSLRAPQISPNVP